MIPRDALHLTAHDRAYIIPRAPLQGADDPPRPPGRRRIARGSQVLALAVIMRPRLGQPLLGAGVARAIWSGGQYRIIECDLVPGTGFGAADLYVFRSAGVQVLQDALDSSHRRLIAGGYEAGMTLVGWDLPFLLSRFARRVRFGRDTASRHMTLDLTGSPWDPCVQITAWDGTRSRIMWTRFAGCRGREEHGHDVFPGLFLDLQEHAHMYSPERLTFSEACALFGVAPAREVGPTDEITGETVNDLFDALRATVDLASGVVTQWNMIGGGAARVPSRPPHGD